AGESLKSKWANRAPGDDSSAGTPEVQLDSAKAPGAVIQNGELRLVESNSPGDRWLCTQQKFDWTPARQGEWIQATFDLKADRLEPNRAGAARIGFFIAAHDFNDNSQVPGG